MECSRSGCKRQEDDPAIMLFGKQIKGLSTRDAGAEIKDELSPRGVDERGTLSFATSSDEEDDPNVSVEATCEDVMIEDSGQKAKKQWEKHEGLECLAEKQTFKEGECPTIRMEPDKQAGKQKGGLWSRCPRCNSADTKFCYFNNYNVNQPRHFCKHCQRYWTAGGTLRNVPVGAGKRKNKYTLHKQAFLTNSMCASDVAKQDAPSGFPDRVSIEKLDPDAVPLVKSEFWDAVLTRNSDSADSTAVNTNLELSAQHSAPPSSQPCIESQPTSTLTTVPSHTPHHSFSLHQLHLDLQSRSMQVCPNLAGGFSKFRRIFPNLACEPSAFSPICPDSACETSGFSTIYPELGGGCSKFPNLACISSGLGQVYPTELPGLSQVHSHLQSGSLGLNQISPDLQVGSSNFAKISPDLQGGSSRYGQIFPHGESRSYSLGQASPHQGSGACESSHECLTYRHNRISGLAKSAYEHDPILDQKRANLEMGLPDSTKITASSDHGLPVLESGLPDLANMNPSANHGLSVKEEANLQTKESCLLLGCSGSKEREVHKRGEGIEMKAPPTCDAQFSSCDTSTLTPLEEAFNGKRGLGQGPPLIEASHNSLPTWAGLWPYFYNMYLMEGVAPLAFPQMRPILTPQGWALPFIAPSAPNVEPTSGGPLPLPLPPPPPSHATIPPTTFMVENFDSSHGRIPLITNTTYSTSTTSSTPTTPRLGTSNPYTIACAPTTTLLSISKDHNPNGAFHVPFTSLGKRSAQRASLEDHDCFCSTSTS